MTFDDWWVENRTDPIPKDGLLRMLWDASAAWEREACAKVCDAQADEPECQERAEYCAVAIRMRSNDLIRGASHEP